MRGATLVERRGVLVILAVAVAACLLPFAARAEAHPHVYWSNFETGTIGRANLDGTQVNQSFIIGADSPLSIAVYASRVYWGNQRGATESCRIGRANLNGANVDQGFIAGATPGSLCSLDGIAVSAGGIFFTSSLDPQGIGRANLNGSGASGLVPIEESSALGVAVDDRFVYWTDIARGSIGRARLDGSPVNNHFVRDIGSPSGIAVDGAHIYWRDIGTGAVGRANLDGTGVDPSFITPSAYECCTAGGVAVNAGHIFWTSTGTDSIGRARLDGSRVNESFITGASDPTGVAVSRQRQGHN